MFFSKFKISWLGSGEFTNDNLLKGNAEAKGCIKENITNSHTNMGPDVWNKMKEK